MWRKSQKPVIEKALAVWSQIKGLPEFGGYFSFPVSSGVDGTKSSIAALAMWVVSKPDLKVANGKATSLPSKADLDTIRRTDWAHNQPQLSQQVEYAVRVIELESAILGNAMDRVLDSATQSALVKELSARGPKGSTGEMVEAIREKSREEWAQTSIP